MKKIKLDTSKLKLIKEKVANLTANEMKGVIGGETGPCTGTPTPTPGIITITKGPYWNCVDATPTPTPRPETQMTYCMPMCSGYCTN